MMNGARGRCALRRGYCSEMLRRRSMMELDALVLGCGPVHDDSWLYL